MFSMVIENTGIFILALLVKKKKKIACIVIDNAQIDIHTNNVIQVDNCIPIMYIYLLCTF
jgi:hypothetical protein